MKKKTIDPRLVVLGSLVIGLLGGLVYAWSIFVKPVCDTYGWETGQVAMMGSVMMACFSLGTTFGGLLLPKVGSTKTSLLGSLLFGGGILLSSLAAHPIMMYLTWGIAAGLGIGMLYSIGMFVASSWYPEKRGFVMGLFLALFGLSLTVFTKPISILLEANGVAPTMTLMGSAFLLLLVPISLFLMKTPPKSINTSANLNTLSAQAMKSCTIKEAIAERSFWTFSGMVFFFGIPYTFINSYASVFCTDFKGLTADQAVAAISAMGIGACLGRLGCGALLDKAGCRITMLLASSFSIISCILLFIGTSYTAMLAAFFLCSAGYGGRATIYGAWSVQQWGQENASAIYGLVCLWLMIASLVGPMITTAAGYNFAIIAAIASIVLGIFCVLLTPRYTPYMRKNQ